MWCSWVQGCGELFTSRQGLCVHALLVTSKQSANGHAWMLGYAALFGFFGGSSMQVRGETLHGGWVVADDGEGVVLHVVGQVVVELPVTMGQIRRGCARRTHRSRR